MRSDSKQMGGEVLFKRTIAVAVVLLTASASITWAEEERQALIRIFFPTIAEAPQDGDLATIDGAAELFRKLTSARFEIGGHTDRLGKLADNLRLSERRARAVAERLKWGGVPEGVIRVQAYGESRPFIATGDGEPEPLNRRVEIELFGAPADDRPREGGF
jgi:outer membrane protein OmpA-like peptidoglycan-associated protein